jgi:hypothetical protein
MAHHTKDKGDLGVFKAQLALAEQGFIICIPLTEHASFDLVAWKENKALTVQVKYRKLDKNNALTFQFRSSWADKHGSHVSKINKAEIDLVCIYCPDTDQCYFLDPNNFKQTVRLRVVNQKSRITKQTRLAKDYKMVPKHLVGA